MNGSSLHNRFFLLLLVLVSIAFGWVLWPFYGAVFWGAILAIIFAPVHRRIAAKLGKRRNLAALATLLLVLLVVIVPVTFITGRSEERRGGKEVVSTCRSWWLPDP